MPIYVCAQSLLPAATDREHPAPRFPSRVQPQAAADLALIYPSCGTSLHNPKASIGPRQFFCDISFVKRMAGCPCNALSLFFHNTSTWPRRRNREKSFPSMPEYLQLRLCPSLDQPRGRRHLAGPTDPRHHPLGAWWQHRYRRPHHCARHEQKSQAAGSDRQPARCRQHRRPADFGTGAGRRLYVHAHVDRIRFPDSESQCRSGDHARSDRTGRLCRQRARGSPLAARQHREGTDCAGEEVDRAN